MRRLRLDQQRVEQQPLLHESAVRTSQPRQRRAWPRLLQRHMPPHVASRCPTPWPHVTASSSVENSWQVSSSARGRSRISSEHLTCDLQAAAEGRVWHMAACAMAASRSVQLGQHEECTTAGKCHGWSCHASMLCWQPFRQPPCAIAPLWGRSCGRRPRTCAAVSRMDRHSWKCGAAGSSSSPYTLFSSSKMLCRPWQQQAGSAPSSRQHGGSGHWQPGTERALGAAAHEVAAMPPRTSSSASV